MYILSDSQNENVLSNICNLCCLTISICCLTISSVSTKQNSHITLFHMSYRKMAVKLLYLALVRHLLFVLLNTVAVNEGIFAHGFVVTVRKPSYFSTIGLL